MRNLYSRCSSFCRTAIQFIIQALFECIHYWLIACTGLKQFYIIVFFSLYYFTRVGENVTVFPPQSNWETISLVVVECKRNLPRPALSTPNSFAYVIKLHALRTKFGNSAQKKKRQGESESERGQFIVQGRTIRVAALPLLLLHYQIKTWNNKIHGKTKTKQSFSRHKATTAATTATCNLLESFHWRCTTVRMQIFCCFRCRSATWQPSPPPPSSSPACFYFYFSAFVSLFVHCCCWRSTCECACECKWR